MYSLQYWDQIQVFNKELKYFNAVKSMNLFQVMSFSITYEFLSLFLSRKIIFQLRRTLLAQAGRRHYVVPNRAEKMAVTLSQ